MKNILLLFLLLSSCADAQISSITATVAQPSARPDLDTFFDVINLQSNDAGNFTIEAPDKVTSWNDLSGNARHAAIATSTQKPLFNISTGVKFDGSNDRLLLPAEFDFNTGTLFCVFKNNVAGNNSAISAAQTDNNRIFYGGTQNLTVVNNNGAHQGTWQLGQLGQYKILSITKSGSSYAIRVNDRLLTPGPGTSTLANNPIKIYSIGYSVFPSAFGEAYVKAYAVTSYVLTDAERNKVISAFMERYGLGTSADVAILGFGDSITQLVANYPVLTGVATNLGLPYINCGVSGTKLSNITGSLNTGQDRYQTTVITRNHQDKIYILFGANDISDGGIAPSDFENSMNVVVAGLLSAGYDPDNICVCSPPYRTNYLSIQTRVDDFVQAALNSATTNGVRYANTIQPLLDTGDPDSYMFDSIHPNSSGAALMATAISNALL